MIPALPMLLSLFLAEAFSSTNAPAAEIPTPIPAPPVVAICSLNNGDADPSLEHWRRGFAEMLENRLRSAGRVAVVSDDDVRDVLTQTGWIPPRPIDANLADEVAHQLDLTHVVWGDFYRRDGLWSLHLRVTGPEATNLLEEFHIAADSVDELLASAPMRLADFFGVRIAPVLIEGWRRRSGSDCAWDEIMQVPEPDEPGLSEEDTVAAERTLRSLVFCEPNFAPARIQLAGYMLRCGRLDEAELELELLSQIQPNWCMPHLARAEIYLRRGDAAAVQGELDRAWMVHPGCPEACELLMFTDHDAQRWTELAAYFEAALAAEPEQVAIRVLAANARMHLNNPEGAKALLEPMGDTRGLGPIIHLVMVENASTLTNLAVAARETRLLQKQATTMPFAQQFLANIDATFYLQSHERYDPPLVPPRAYTATELRQTLQRIAHEEGVTLVDPVEPTPELTQLSRVVTAGLTNLSLRALLIFDEVTRRGRGLGVVGTRTAAEALRVSEERESRLSCQEYAKLFVALSRAAGLESWLVHVDRDPDNKPLNHDCAVLFLPESRFLVDPTAGELIARHKGYRILNDVEAIAHQALQGGTAHDLPRQRAGIHLDPEDIVNQLIWIYDLAQASHSDEAEAALAKLQAHAGKRWDYHLSAAAVASSRGRWHHAAAELRTGLSLAPSSVLLHSELAKVYGNLGEFAKSRKEAEEAIRLDEADDFQTHTRKTQSYLEAAAAFELSQSTQPPTRDTLLRRAEAGDATAQFAMADLSFKEQPPDNEQGLKWLHKAAEHGNDQFEFQYARALINIRGSSAATEIVEWLTRASEKGNSGARFHLSLILYEGKLVPADPVAGYRWAWLALEGGFPEARHLLREMELFLDKDQVAEAIRQAKELNVKR